MKMIEVILAMLLMLPSLPALTQEVPEWHRELVMKAPFGDGEGEFAAEVGSRGMENFIGDNGSFVCSYFIDSTEVYIPDLYRSEIKIFELDSGRFVKSIPLIFAFDGHPDSGRRLWGAQDIEVVEDTLYILLATVTNPPRGLSFYSIFTYDIGSGRPLKRYRIHNEWLGADLEFTEHPVLYGGVHLSVGEGKDIYVYDRPRHRSYRILSDGRVTPEEEHELGVTGRVCGRRRYDWAGKSGQTLILAGMGGEDVSGVIPLPWTDISRDGSYLVAYSPESNADERVFVYYVYRHDGVAVGRITVDLKLRRKEFGGPCEHYFIYTDGRVYEINSYDDGVYLYRWGM